LRPLSTSEEGLQQLDTNPIVQIQHVADKLLQN